MKWIVESGTALRASVERRCAPQWKKMLSGHPLRTSRFPLPTSRSPLTSKGFTLVEMVMVIVITGIIGGIVAVFIKAPVQGYMDSARRAELTDIADTTFRRVGRDLRLALPNSVRVSADGLRVEFLPTKGGGRYRAGPAGDELLFTPADNSFDVLGPPVAANAGDYLVIYNFAQPSLSGCTSIGLDAYEGCNRRTITAGGATITFTPTALPFPADSPGHRFHVISSPVSYICDAGTLWRYAGYAIQDVQTKTDTVAELDALAGAQKARLATNVGSCSFTYDASVVAQRSGLVTMRLDITQDSETVSLYSATHVSNQP